MKSDPELEPGPGFEGDIQPHSDSARRPEKASSASPTQSEPDQPQAIVQVVVPVPLHGVFDYQVPVAMQGRLRRGMRVRVPFGRKQLIGLVFSFSAESSLPVNKLRAVLEPLEDEPVLSEDVLQLLEWAAAYYHHPLGEVMLNALPVQLRQGREAVQKQASVWRISEQGRHCDRESLKRAPKQAALLDYLAQSDGSGYSAEQLNQDWAHWRPSMQSLVDKGLVNIEKQDALQAITQGVASQPTPELNAQQAEAVKRVCEALGNNGRFLLQGITGSGKTEVYLEIIQQVLEQGRQVLVLVPEISLTPQLTRRFAQRLETALASLHSGLNDSQRHSAWLQASQGQARVVIGTRSALFTPMPELGLIILDEEHDASFKQQEGFRYHARDLALVRARNAGIPVVMGSATPSFESLENVRKGHFELLRLTRRGAAGAKPPRISLLDVCRRPMQDGLSDILQQKIREHLEQQGQVLLFLNRRGYAPMLMCHECGWTTACQRCDANMTLHQHNQRLRCHHCGYETAAPAVCPSCQHEELYIPGAGTERIETSLKQQFPEISISRIDRDTTRRKGELDRKLSEAREGEAKILIGTQMLAKGHDFPNVTLVGIINADQGLFSADFRGTEHMAQLIIQVAGRAGRGEKPGEVVIQTHHPEHPLLHTLLESGYDGFAQAALEERRQAQFPPFSYMAIIRCEATQKSAGEVFLNEAREAFNYSDVQVFGPLPAPMERRAGRYRWQLILLAEERKQLHGACRHWVPKLGKLKSANRVRWSIDIDPQDMF